MPTCSENPRCRSQPKSYPALVLRFRGGGGIFLDGSDGTKEFARDSSFIRRGPWAA
jgi:hypothetical protein